MLACTERDRSSFRIDNSHHQKMNDEADEDVVIEEVIEEHPELDDGRIRVPAFSSVRDAFDWFFRGEVFFTALGMDVRADLSREGRVSLLGKYEQDRGWAEVYSDSPGLKLIEANTDEFAWRIIKKEDSELDR